MDVRQLDGIAALCAGGLVAAESALLLLGMNVPTVSAWSTPRNVALGVSDVVLGSVLIYAALSGRAAAGDWMYWASAGALALTHAFREVEFLAAGSEPFARSPALFVFNNVRLALLGLSAGLTLCG
ncbi:MAG TPA: hypothetical protein VFI08_14850 [Spirochaetia bacterium]|nr:hypothetical protein [Spirochaetia bacterium]